MFNLGKLSANQIKAGYQALKEIEHFIKKHQFNSAFIEANNTYYTRSQLKYVSNVQNDIFLFFSFKFLMNLVDRHQR